MGKLIYYHTKKEISEAIFLFTVIFLLTTNSFAQFNPLWTPQQTNNPSTGTDRPYAITANASGIYVAGYDFSPGNSQWRIEKRNLTTGALIAAFGTSGVVTSNPSANPDEAYAITADASGIYIAGFSGSPGATDYQWRIEKRDLTTGLLITGFGASGVVTTNPSTGYDYIFAITADANGIYVAGTDALGGNNEWRIEKRDLITGALIGAFGTSGVVTNNPSAGSDQALAITADASGIYVAGCDYSPGTNYQWRIEKRDLTTGGLDAAFGTGGVITNNPSTSTDQIFAITCDASGIYAAGWNNPGNYQWRIEKRDLTTGLLITTFGTSGVVISNPSASGDYVYAITNDAGGIYVAGYDYIPGNGQWRVEKRDKNDGSLLCTLQSNPSTSSTDIAYAITNDASGIYVAGHAYNDVSFNYEWRIEKYDLCGTLPIEFISLSGYNKEYTNILEWETGSEKNSDCFKIERSSSGSGQWQEIGRIKGAGNSNANNNYQFIDPSPLSGGNNGVSYYRLRQTDYDGKITYSQTVSVTMKQVKKLTIYPNPARENLQLTAGSLQKETSVEIIDVSGRVILKFQILNPQSPINIDISSLSHGMYFLKVTNGAGLTQTKFIKEEN